MFIDVELAERQGSHPYGPRPKRFVQYAVSQWPRIEANATSITVDPCLFSQKDVTSMSMTLLGPLSLLQSRARGRSISYALRCLR